MPTGAVTFTVYLGTKDCDAAHATGTDTATVALDAAGVAHAALSKVVMVGGLSYKATYNGSAIYNTSTGDCEPLTATKLDSSTVTVIHDEIGRALCWERV